MSAGALRNVRTPRARRARAFERSDALYVRTEFFLSARHVRTAATETETSARVVSAKRLRETDDTI